LNQLGDRAKAIAHAESALRIYEAIEDPWAAKVRAKLFIINENGDYFWLDRAHWRLVLEFALYRAGLTGTAAVPAIARLVFFPVTLAYLVLYAATVHLRRRIRLL
jgi:hypothetical protein